MRCHHCCSSAHRPQHLLWVRVCPIPVIRWQRSRSSIVSSSVLSQGFVPMSIPTLPYCKNSWLSSSFPLNQLSPFPPVTMSFAVNFYIFKALNLSLLFLAKVNDSQLLQFFLSFPLDVQLFFVGMFWAVCIKLFHVFSKLWHPNKNWVEVFHSQVDNLIFVTRDMSVCSSTSVMFTW